MGKKIIGLFAAIFIIAGAVLLFGTAGEAKKASIQHVKMKVSSKNFKWQNVPGMTMKLGDILIMKAEGKVKVYTDISGEYFAGPSGGAGSLKDSELQVRIGKFAATFPGSKFVILDMKKEGDVKLRFRDKKYSDNKGEFDVTLLLIPGALIPEVKEVQPVVPEKK